MVIAAFAVMAVLLGFYWNRSQGPVEDDPVWVRMQTSGEVRICLDPSFPPFESTEKGTNRLLGFDIDLGKELARRLGLASTFVPTGFDGLYDALMANACDLVISAFPYDPRQTEDFVFSVAYFNAGQVLVVPASAEPARGMSDLAGMKVAIEWGADGDVIVRRWAKRIPLTPHALETSEGALQAVAEGDAQAAIVDATSAYSYIHKDPSLTVSATITEDNYVVVMRPDAYTLVGYVNRALMDMREEGFLDRLQNRWF